MTPRIVSRRTPTHALRGLTLLVLGALLAPSALAGRNFIAGVVQDRNGDPVPRAQIKLVPEEEDKGTFLMVTDSEGRFTIDYLREDDGSRTKLARKTNYDLEIFKAGFHIQTKKFFYKRGDVTLDAITLVEDSIRIDADTTNLPGNIERTDAGSGGGSYEGP